MVVPRVLNLWSFPGPRPPSWAWALLLPFVLPDLTSLPSCTCIHQRCSYCAIPDILARSLVSLFSGASWYFISGVSYVFISVQHVLFSVPVGIASKSAVYRGTLGRVLHGVWTWELCLNCLYSLSQLSPGAENPCYLSLLIWFFSAWRWGSMKSGIVLHQWTSYGWWTCYQRTSLSEPEQVDTCAWRNTL